jgi:hypothetical protein
MAMSQSRLQSLLGEDVVFQSRCKVQMLDVAATVMAEPAATAHHTARAAYAKQVLLSPEGMARIATQFIARSTNVTAAGIEMTDTGVLANIGDAELLSQISSSWNTLAGIDTGV